MMIATTKSTWVTERKRLNSRELGCAFYLFIRQPMGRKSALRREILWILRGFQGRLSC